MPNVKPVPQTIADAVLELFNKQYPLWKLCKLRDAIEKRKAKDAKIPAAPRATSDRRDRSSRNPETS